MRGVFLILLCTFQINAFAESGRDFFMSQMHRFENQSTSSQKLSDSFFQTHELIFFFASTCPYCHKVAPHLKQWMVRHDMKVQAISLDNKPLPEFPNFLNASKNLVQAAFNQHSIEYPALFVMHKKTNRLYPVMLGEFNEWQLESRMEALLPKIIQYEGEGQ